MRTLWSILAGIVLVVAAGAITAAQTVIRETTLDRQYLVGARGAAMGDNYVADTYDVSAMYRNPATLAFIENRGIILDYFQDVDNDYSRESASLPILTGPSWVMGAGLSVEHATDRAEDRLPLKYGEYGIDLAAGVIADRHFSVGAAFGIRTASPASGPSFAGTWTLGLCYNPSYRLAYAFAYRGGRDGFLYDYDPASTTTDLSPAPMTHAVSAGLMLRLPDVRTRRHVLALSLEGNVIFHGPEEGSLFSGGIEVLPWKFLALRLGYKTGRGVERARYGAGLVFDGWGVDYAISPSWVEPRYQHLTVHIDFGS